MEKRQGIMLCYPMEQKRLALWSPPYIGQPKLDGERCRAEFDGRSWNLISSELNHFVSVPHIQKAVQDYKFEEKGIFELDGELYQHGLELSEIHSVVGRSVNLHPDYERMMFHVFDLPNDKPQAIRLSSLSLLDLKPPLVRVPFKLLRTIEEIYAYYDSMLELGYEGIVLRELGNYYVRKRSTSVMKFKPKKQDEYEIVGFVEAFSKNGAPKGMVGAIVCKGVGEDDFFKVGAGNLTHPQRIEYWDERYLWKGKTCIVKYQSILPSGSPRFGLCFELVNEKFGLLDNFNPLIED